MQKDQPCSNNHQKTTLKMFVQHDSALLVCFRTEYFSSFQSAVNVDLSAGELLWNYIYLSSDKFASQVICVALVSDSFISFDPRAAAVE